MPRVLPSEAVAAFGWMFPFLADPVANLNIAVNVASLNALVALVDQIPHDLITVGGADLARLVEPPARIVALGLQASVSDVPLAI